ncbi:glycosyl hydrolase [Zafaria cholistanensis]|uniref:Glycosyl hydrolase n=1 Tax=Zafaria cholistanensis TaxID=1682741 RepID=A0A5A7NPQ7_9MICC|nr:carbohydrate-binding protein [Zafaria cholistanensis]GER21741.1 glycosyl hydrolase [Zafaria cholistanensis]
MASRFAGRRLSVVRLSIVLAIAALLVQGALLSWGKVKDAAQAEQTHSWFGPYVDATSTPFYPIGDGVAAGERVVLAFAVADPEKPCRPSWGGYYSMDEAAGTFDLDRRVARVHEAGASVVVSTGGLINEEPAVACEDPAQLVTAYADLLERYDSSTLDLDIEGPALENPAASARRVQAVRELQGRFSAAGKPLEVWLTLPVATGGLTAAGLAEVERYVAGGVDLAGVNLMTMNFGETRSAGQSMAAASIQAARSAHQQLKELYGSHGEEWGEMSLWSKIGLTPMLGQNDLMGEIFTLQDARDLNAFALEVGVGRVSLWSANRDFDCGPNYPDPTRVSNNCSGVPQGQGEFSSLLAQNIEKVAPPPAAAPSGGLQAAQSAPAATAIVDNPETSPYPIWEEEAAYVEAERVVWRGNVYEAKWWTQGDAPDAPVAAAAETPWTLVGPVLPGDKPEKPVTAPKGLYPNWSPKRAYSKGDRVLFEGRVLEAKWWNTAESPEAALRSAANTPWRVLANDQVKALVVAFKKSSGS